MTSDQFGNVILSEDEVFSALYSGKLRSLANVNICDQSVIDRFNQSVDSNADQIDLLQKYVEMTCSIEEYDKIHQKTWVIPDDYYPNLVEFLYSACTTTEQRDRISLELRLFNQHGMSDVLYVLKYLVDYMREHEIVWGLGRGSSVSSYCLFLIGVHKIDSIKYQLDITEFLKGE